MAERDAAIAPPDRAERDRILEALDQNLLVEAAAGTGKTTSMVGRMVALLREGRCEIATLTAVTFTRKAASELRARFQVGLERAAREERDPARRARLDASLAGLGLAFVGTIHSFCARLLRERPVEAGVDPAFEELDDVADARLRAQAWQAMLDRLREGDEAMLLARLDALGLDPAEIEPAFANFAAYPDVDDWPAPDPAEALDLAPAAKAVAEYAERMRALVPTLPGDAGNDRLIPLYRRIPRVVAHLQRIGVLADPARLGALLVEFDRKASVVQKMWPGGKAQALEERDAWEAFREATVRPTLEALQARRYGLAIQLLRGADEQYTRLRREGGRLNYQDLLLLAARLLREQPHVRRYFQQRFTHLLVDEFQDTDPVQAEVVMLLTASDSEQRDWRRCEPRPGSLFVVGDPKQSIYRFRRADIVTYSAVRERIVANRGGVVRLSANFRCSTEIQSWVNRSFAPAFPESATEFSPSYVALQQGRPPAAGPDRPLAGVFTLTVPRSAGRATAGIVAYEAARIARTIAAALEQRSPADFMIIARRKRHLSAYAAALTRLGVPCRVTGGTALGEVEALHLLRLGLKAVVHPDDPVALVAALRSELFGVSDADLFELKRCQGRFDFRGRLPEALAPELAERLAAIFAVLEEASQWLERRPAMAAVERLVERLELMPAALSGPGGGDAAGGLIRALELLRAASAESWTAAQIAERLDALVSGEEAQDSLPALAALDGPAVQIMNLHKAKGLEASVVFLADPTGRSAHPITRHVERGDEQTRGYLAIGRGSGYGWRALARPRARDWQVRAEREQQFLDAEEVRLDYVAATRAGEGLVISQRESANGQNPWSRFGAHLAEAPELADPGEPPAIEPRTSRPEPEAATAALAAIARRHDALRSPTYAAGGAKALASGLAGEAMPVRHEAAGPMPEAGDGAAWGEVIHQLLELAALSPQADLARHAQPLLREHELDEALAEAAAAWVRQVRRSALWQRAAESDRQLVEVPFTIAADAIGLPADRPTVVRGCIDLAFREADGWVVVDYKTDRTPAQGLDALVQRHAGQVRLYGRAFERITGETVKERALLFLRSGEYVAV